MYKAINDQVIVKKDYTEKNINGIIVPTTGQNTEKQILEFEVVATTELTQELQGKTICAARHKIGQLTDGELVYGSLSYKDILAIKE